MNAPEIYKDRAFFAPTFQIALKGQNVGQEVLRDVMEVTFTNDLENIDSFEFALGDWDEVARLPKYSSPWDADGKQRKTPDGQYDLPNFEPGAEVELKIGYHSEGDLVRVMKGSVTSISTSFPAAGAPVCRIRVLNDLHKLQRVRVTGNFKETRLDNAVKMLKDNGVKVVIEREGDIRKGKPTEETVNGQLYEEVFARAREHGLTISMEETGSGPVLTMTPPGEDKAVALLEWGRSLLNFTPTLSTRGQVEKVVVRSTDTTKSGDAKKVLAEAVWADLKVARPSELLGPKSDAELESALSGVIEYIDADEKVKTEEDAKALAEGRLKEIASELVKASGATLGAPELMAGKLIEIAGLGARFSGLYRLTQTTHTLGDAGYTTSFQARKEVLRG